MCILYKSIGTSGYRNSNSGWARLSLVRFPDPLWALKYGLYGWSVQQIFRWHWVNIGLQCSWLGRLVPYTLCNGTLHWRRQTVLLDWMNLRSEGMILMELDFPQKRKITRICISLMTLFDPQQHFEIALYGNYYIWKAISLHNKYFACHVEQNCPTWQAILLHVVCIIMIYTVLMHNPFCRDFRLVRGEKWQILCMQLGPHFIFVTTITTTGCVKKSVKCKIFQWIRERNWFNIAQNV